MIKGASKYQYVILPARPSDDFEHRDLYNKAYRYWKEYWQRIFKLKAPTFWNPIDFYRQNLVFCIMDGENIVAQNLGSFANIQDDVTKDLPYFESFKGAAFEVIANEKSKSAMTIEYTSVNPNYGERRTGLRFAEIINGLGLETFKAKEVDVTFGTPRRMTGLSEVTANYGYRKISEGLQKAGWNLDVYLGFKNEIKQHPDPIYRQVIEGLWNNRVDYSTQSQRVNRIGGESPRKVAAMSLNIRANYNEIMEDVCAAFDSLHWEDKNVYGLFLTQAYGLVRHTTRLLSLCAGYCPFEYEETHKRLIEHRSEEEGHDNIALADLKALGVDPNVTPELTETKKLIQRQYDQMKNVSALSFFGYILLLEGLAVLRGEYLRARVEQAFGPKTTRFLKLHADDDIEHIEKALKQIEGFDIDDQVAAIDNLRASASLYKDMLKQVMTLAPTIGLQEKGLSQVAELA